MAAAAGYDPVVLYDQLPASVETFIVLEGKEGEEKTKVAKVKYKEGEETKTMLLHDYAKVNMARYLPALELAEGTKTKGKKGTMFTKQHADGGGDDQKSRSASILGSKYARKKKE